MSGDELRAGIETGHEQLLVEIRASEEETRRLMRVLHQEVIDRLTVIQKSIDAGRQRSRRPQLPRRKR